VLLRHVRRVVDVVVALGWVGGVMTGVLAVVDGWVNVTPSTLAGDVVVGAAGAAAPD
jgi:hypothetical protein